MINLIPQTAKRSVRREYWLRVVSVWAILLASTFFVCALLLVPTHVLLSRQLDAIASEIVALEDTDEAAEYQVAQESVREANRLAKQLDEPAALPFGTGVLPVIRDAQSTQITLTGLLYTANGEKVTAIEVRGIAATRNALVAFVDELKRNPLVADAVVPVGDLAPERALPFTLTLTLSPQNI